jgi:hypothetical protein
VPGFGKIPGKFQDPIARHGEARKLQGPHVFCRNFNRRTGRLPEIAMANVISLTVCRFICPLVASVLTVSVLAGAALGQAPESRFADVNRMRLHYLAAGKGEPIDEAPDQVMPKLVDFLTR